MDLFGPNFVKSLSKKSYCLVITDDYSRFSWVFFLASKDETAPVLKTFIIGLENLLSLKVKAEAVNTACYVQNRVLVTKPHNKTPYELLHGRLPSSGSDWLFDIDSLTRTMNYHPDLAKNQTNSHADALVDGKEHDDNIQKSVSPNIHSLSSGDQTRKQGDKTENKDKGKSPVVTIIGFRDLNADSNDFSTAGPSNAAMPNLKDPSHSNDADDKVWILVDLPYGKRAIGTKWVYRNKKDERGIVIKNKARLVTQGHTQEEGIDYEEVFAPVARIKAIRLFLAYASFMGFPMYQMDVKSAFLYGTIEEEVYICQPPGFKDPENPNKVHKLVKALYGLHQAPRAWSSGKSASTPIDAEKPLLKDSDGKDVDVHTYSQENLQILEGKALPGLMKQTVIATSSTKAEYVADASGCAQVMWIQNQLLDYGDSPLLGVNTPRSDEDRLKLMELIVFWLQKDVCVNFGLTAVRLSSYCCQANVSAVWLLQKSDAAEGFKQIIYFLCGIHIHYALTVNPHIYISCIKQFWNTASVKRSGDVTRLQALVDKKKIVISDVVIREILQLDDAEGMLADRQPAEEELVDEQVQVDVAVAAAIVEDVAEDAAHDAIPSPPPHDIPSPFQEPSLPPQQPHVTPLAPTQGEAFPANFQQVLDTCSALFRHVEHLEHNNVAQRLEILKLKARVKKLEKTNKVKSSKFRRLRKVGASGRVESSDDMEDVFNQGRMITEDVGIKLVKDAEITESEGRQADKQAEIYNIDLDHSLKVLNVVTAAALQVGAASATIPAAKIKEELTSKTPAETPKVKDKGKCIMVETPKPMKKKDQIELDAEYARKLHEEINKDDAEFNKDIDWDAAMDHVNQKSSNNPQYIKRYQGMKKRPQTESEARKNMMIYLKNTAGYKMDFFKGMSYADICPIFQARFDENIRFLFKSREEIEEEDEEIIKSINETPLEIVHDEDDDVFTEATPLGRKVPVVDYEIVMINNQPRYKIIRADDTHQLYISFITLLKNFDREDLEDLWRIMKDKFSTSKPSNFFDDYLLSTLKTMFEKTDGQDSIWRNQQSLLELMLSKRSKKNTKCVNAADEELTAAKHKLILVKDPLSKGPPVTILNHRQIKRITFRQFVKTSKLLNRKINLPMMNHQKLSSRNCHPIWSMHSWVKTKSGQSLSQKILTLTKNTLINVLKSRKKAIAWKLTDIRGIDLEFCSHKILLEEDFSPKVQSQRRVNHKIHDIIKKEVENFLTQD
nr:copia protein [Tanacetum cinerariifolium]